VLAELRRVLGVPVRVTAVEEPEAFERRLAQAYSQASQSPAYVADAIGQDMDLSRLVQEMPKIEDPLDSDNDAPVIRMINVLLTQALRQKASDIHIEPYDARSVVRFRLDGTLHTVAEPHRGLHAAMLSRIKIMANLDIAEKRLPQDGRISLRLAGRQVDVRVATLPTGYGERAVLRLLDKEASQFQLGGLGMDESTPRGDRHPDPPAARHRPRHRSRPGSGKTTTLYAALERIDSLGLNIMTVEDPGRVRARRHRPDAGQREDRDDRSRGRCARSCATTPTSSWSARSATARPRRSRSRRASPATSSSPRCTPTTPRARRPGWSTWAVEPYLLSSSLLGVLAQRLVRKLCPACKQPHQPSAPDLAELGELYRGEALYAPGGCSACNNTGYVGRTGIYELLVIDEDAKALIHGAGSEQRLRAHAAKRGMRSLRQDGLRWVLSGATFARGSDPGHARVVARCPPSATSPSTPTAASGAAWSRPKRRARRAPGCAARASCRSRSPRSTAKRRRRASGGSSGRRACASAPGSSRSSPGASPCCSRRASRSSNAWTR
jgi:general secretion pathway protein E